MTKSAIAEKGLTQLVCAKTSNILKFLANGMSFVIFMTNNAFHSFS